MNKMSKKQVVLLTGASGSMGLVTFKLLWEKRDRYDIVLLLRPSKKNRKQFRGYERQAGSEEGTGLKIVWGDILNREDVVEACRGIDWCLHTLALISPAADRDPDMAELVNARGTRYLVEAIEEENPNHIRFVNVSTVAEYGDRLPPVHMTRTGDPILPSIYDYYSLTKIKGELAVMQSRIKHRVSLRQTFIMIPDLLSLKDSIMFHQPIHSLMEGITSRDSGRLLINCLDVEDDSDFWGGYYNISGGPGCRIAFLEILDRIYSLLGIRYRKVMERKWFALKNFHMQFLEDSDKLNHYLHHWEGGQHMDDYIGDVRKNLPWYLKATAWFARYIPPFRIIVEAITRLELKKLAYKADGTMTWIANKDMGKIHAFYGSLEAYQHIPPWGEGMPSMDHSQEYLRLDHGYDESKEEFDIQDLHKAATFRGGQLVSNKWDGDVNTSLSWVCCQGHPFSMTAHAVLKGGHWCMECIAPPWNYHLIVNKNPFVTQLLKPEK